MKNIWRLFMGDLRRLKANTVTIIVVVGLVALPSIFSWYNMLACWDVFDNTGNLTVAVANVDEGYVSDLVPIEVNVGDRVVSALRENEQLNWTFTTKDDAIDGTESGRYYAAVVIPESFSRDMMSFFSEDSEHASIVYYSNEKKNAVAPKVTDQGADQVSRQVNLVFTETLSEVALGISQGLIRSTGEANVDGAIATLQKHLSEVGSQMGQSSSVLSLYADVLGSARHLVEDSATMLTKARDAAHEVVDTGSGVNGVADSVSASVSQTTDALSKAIGESAASYAALPAAIDAAFDSANALSRDSAAELRNRAGEVDAVIADYRSVVSTLKRLQDATGDPEGAIKSIITRLNSSIALQEQLRDSLLAAASDIETTNSETQADRQGLIETANQAKSDIDNARADYDANLAPQLAQLSAAMEDSAKTLSSTGSQLDSAAGSLVGESSSLASQIGDSQERLVAMAGKLKESGEAISGLADELARALSESNSQALRDLVSSDPATLAEAISAPVKLSRQAVYPVENFGSAMSPLYTTLALWIGALLMMVTLKITPSSRTVSELEDPSPRELLLGRFGIVAFISLLQSTTIALGNLLFLEVQAVNPVLYVLCFWIAGLVFAFIIYTLVALFANFGKALSVILLIVQVSGGGGSFPLKLLPDFFQMVSPYLPITHAVNAMRAAMFGIYANDFWIEIATLVAFTIPFAILGIALHAPLSRFVPKFVARVEKSKLM